MQKTSRDNDIPNWKETIATVDNYFDLAGFRQQGIQQKNVPTSTKASFPIN